MKIKKLAALALVLSFLSITPIVSASTLYENAQVSIKNIDNISTANATQGNTVRFTTTREVRDSHGTILIAQNAPVVAKMTYVKPAKKIGVPGELTISDFYVTAVDGTQVPLSITINEKAESKVRLSITLSAILLPFFLLMKGKHAEIPAGTVRSAHVARDININAY